jgi:hypothetical protein
MPLLVYDWGNCPRFMHFIGGLLGPKAGLNIMEETKLSFSYQELNLDSSAINPIA